MPDRHITKRSLDAVKSLGVVDDGEGLDHFIPASAHIRDHPIPAFTEMGYLAMVIGASFETKKLPVPRLIELCSLLQMPIVLVGGPEDAAAGEQISASGPGRIFNACGYKDCYGTKKT
jgi:heptosyltransferase-2